MSDRATQVASGWSGDRRSRGSVPALLARGFAVIFLFALVAGARRLSGGAEAGTATRHEPVPDPGWAEDLRKDRRFERSLLLREVAVIALIGALVFLRQYFS